MVTVVAGLGLVVLVTVDAVLHRPVAGPPTLVTGAAVWTTGRALARTVGRPGLLHGDELQLRQQWISDRSPSASSYAPGGRWSSRSTWRTRGAGCSSW